MARTPRWTKVKFESGIAEIRLSSWKYFSDYVNQELLDYTTYVYRGHGNSKWKLEPTLDRIIKSPGSPKRTEHLDAFKYAVRGRRGSNPATMEDENDWWALGQHHGLSTPLLDWTESPFVALYFAVTSAINNNTNNYSVSALSQGIVRRNNSSIEQDATISTIDGRKPVVEIVKPFSDENRRLVSKEAYSQEGQTILILKHGSKGIMMKAT